MNVGVFREDYEVSSLDELRARLTARYKGRYGAFWLSVKKDKCPAMSMFVNDKQAWLFFIREEGDPGFHLLGPDPDNFTDHVEFVIDNYQSDLYPRAMIVSTSDGERACEEFFQTNALPMAIPWLEL